MLAPWLINPCLEKGLADQVHGELVTINSQSMLNYSIFCDYNEDASSYITTHAHNTHMHAMHPLSRRLEIQAPLSCVSPLLSLVSEGDSQMVALPSEPADGHAEERSDGQGLRAWGWGSPYLNVDRHKVHLHMHKEETRNLINPLHASTCLIFFL